jgi:hypothetical protein
MSGKHKQWRQNPRLYPQYALSERNVTSSTKLERGKVKCISRVFAENPISYVEKVMISGCKSRSTTLQDDSTLTIIA